MFGEVEKGKSSFCKIEMLGLFITQSNKTINNHQLLI